MQASASRTLAHRLRKQLVRNDGRNQRQYAAYLQRIGESARERGRRRLCERTGSRRRHAAERLREVTGQQARHERRVDECAQAGRRGQQPVEPRMRTRRQHRAERDEPVIAARRQRRGREVPAPIGASPPASVSANGWVAVIPDALAGCVSLPGVVYRPIAGRPITSALALAHRRFEKAPAVRACLRTIRPAA